MTQGQSFLFAVKKIESTYGANLTPLSKKKYYSTWIWILTFMVYCSYHLSRKPISVVKNVLNRDCGNSTPIHNNTHWCDWKPFDEDDSTALLGVLDSVYLFCYAFGMFFSGAIAERMRLNIFLFIGMVTSGAMTALFGFGYTFQIHVFWYYILVQMIGGVVQSTGWPGVVTVMGNWFGKERRGLIMGIWNSHTSLGNILGSLIASAFLHTGWDLSFIVPGIIIGVMGVVVLFFLVPEPADVGIENPNAHPPTQPEPESDEEASQSLLHNNTHRSDEEISIRTIDVKPVNFFNAFKIPGVLEFSFSLFFSKLVSYTFLYWLPHFIFDSTSSDADQSGEISTFFDIGGIIGGILAGVINDSTGMPASTCVIMLTAAIPMIYVYQGVTSSVSLWGNMLLLIPVGVLVNGPYALITTAVSAELGTHSSLRGSAKALSTVSSIIDGTGSMGAALGPLIAGLVSSKKDWSKVFLMMILADIFSLVLLLRLVKKETLSLYRSRNER